MARWPGEPRPVKTPAGQGEPVLYLDFDGVLHHEDVLWHPRRGAVMGPNAAGHRLFEYVPLLQRLLEDFPEVKIVLSTSWVRAYGFTGAAKRLGPVLRQRCIGATFHTGMWEDSFARLPRGLQVADDVRRRQPAGWVAIDDDHGDWPVQYEPHLVRSDPVLGISAPPVFEEVRSKLQAITERRSHGR